MKKQASFFLEHIQQEINNLKDFTRPGYDAYLHDVKTRHAIIRSFEIIGEAARNLGAEFHQQYPTVEWQKLVSFRNKLSPEYFRLDFDKVWVNATVKILVFEVVVRQLLIVYPPPVE